MITSFTMAPKVIECEGFKFREELSKQHIDELIVDGGAEKVKEALTQWGYNIVNEKVAVPIMVIGNDGKVTGGKWSGSWTPRLSRLSRSGRR